MQDCAVAEWQNALLVSTPLGNHNLIIVSVVCKLTAAAAGRYAETMIIGPSRNVGQPHMLQSLPHLTLWIHTWSMKLLFSYLWMGWRRTCLQTLMCIRLCIILRWRSGHESNNSLRRLDVTQDNKYCNGAY